MAATAVVEKYVKDGSKIIEVEGLQSIGVAGNFVTFTYEDGTVVLERENEFKRVEFRPASEEASDADAESQDNTNSQ